MTMKESETKGKLKKYFSIIIQFKPHIVLIHLIQKSIYAAIIPREETQSNILIFFALTENK